LPNQNGGSTDGSERDFLSSFNQGYRFIHTKYHSASPRETRAEFSIALGRGSRPGIGRQGAAMALMVFPSTQKTLPPAATTTVGLVAAANGVAAQQPPTGPYTSVLGIPSVVT
jgi:hypothetical protein